MVWKRYLNFYEFSRCYRPELSGTSAESKLYRVHEFNKVGFQVEHLIDEMEKLSKMYRVLWSEILEIMKKFEKNPG